MSLSNFDIHYTPGIDAATVRAALDRFQTRHGRLRHAIHVHPSSVGITELALTRLGLDIPELALTRLGLDIPVHPNGGALYGEIWLQTNGEKTPYA